MGFDFMCTSGGKVVLLEVNTSPALFRHGRVLTDLLPRVIEEVVQKVVDPLFPPPPGSTSPEPILNSFELLPLFPAPALGAAAALKGPVLRRTVSAFY